MILRELLAEVESRQVRGPLDREVTGLALDSRRVQQGHAFFALPGVNADGARFAAAAVAAGAVAVIGPAGLTVEGVTQVEVDEPRLALAQAAARFHGHPSRNMDVIAVTGTNGKTTTTYLCESILEAVGARVGVIGTTGIRIAGETLPSAFTTPEAPELQALLARMRDAQVRAVALEASSHALVQRRTYGLDCDVCVFTNLTQDHLDYHGTMDAYRDAKLMLFDGRNGGGQRATAVVNADDPSASHVLAAAVRGGQHVRVYGSRTAVGARDGVALAKIDPQPNGLALVFAESAGGLVTEHACALPMLGRFNAWNAAAAFAAARALGVSAADAVRGLEQSRGVPGRLERVVAGQLYEVVVDYAHTPDALERALAACREHTHGRVLVVFGCGGDRDRGKRPIMGAIAARLADRAWVTNDNPRSEDPAAIAADIVAGASAGTLEVVLDRRSAIDAALAAARAGDLVLIAGKGHETTQTLGTQVLPFDDRAVARELLAGRTGAGAM